jgi:KaiC/GvpD/RAD55 family RecA-like ATPase
VLLSGYSGIGKSSVAHELHKVQAERLAASLRRAAENQHSGLKKHFEDAAWDLEQAVDRARDAVGASTAKLEEKVDHARDAAGASEEELEKKNEVLLEKTRTALHNLKEAARSHSNS